MQSLIAFIILLALARGMQFGNIFATCRVEHARPDSYANARYRTNANNPQCASPRSAFYYL